MSKIANLPDRAVIRLAGEERRNFLQGLITQDIDRLTPGAAIFTCLLTPQGKILFDFFIADVGDEHLIDCDKEAAPALIKRLALYKLRAKITITLDETLTVCASENEIALPGVIAFTDPRHKGLGYRGFASQADDDAIDDYHRRRIALGVPEFGPDFGSEELFLLDANYDALNAVSYKKGCFVGQEVTSRMKRKGEARKRTLIAEFDGGAPEKNAAITAGGSTLGQVLNVASNQALVLIRLDRWEKAKNSAAALVCGDKELSLRLPDYLKQD